MISVLEPIESFMAKVVKNSEKKTNSGCLRHTHLKHRYLLFYVSFFVLILFFQLITLRISQAPIQKFLVRFACIQYYYLTDKYSCLFRDTWLNEQWVL